MNPDHQNTAYQFVLNEHAALMHRLAVATATASALAQALKSAEAEIAKLKADLPAEEGEG